MKAPPMATSAATRGWGKAPAPRSSIVTLRRADGLALPVHTDIASLVAWLCDETERRGYDLNPAWCWGYAPRKVRGSKTVWSNHAWGLAIDLNAPANPLTENGKVVSDMPAWVPQLWKSYGFGWGGDYPGARKDPMHFEFLGTKADAARFTLQTKTARPALKLGSIGEAVKLLQARLNAHGAKLKVDGLFGPKTHDVVRWFQGTKGLVIDGIVGPRTWKALG